MDRPRVEWDPSWDDDWRTVQGRLEEEIEEKHPRNPEEAVSLYRYGFSTARQHPLKEWSFVESDLYEDYMGGAPRPGESPNEEDVDWDRIRTWAFHGWKAAQ